MLFTHGCTAHIRIVETMLRCNIVHCSGGTDRRIRIVTTRFRPIHCNFGSLRHAGERVRMGQGHHNHGPATNEQISGRGWSAASRVGRPSMMAVDFREV